MLTDIISWAVTRYLTYQEWKVAGTNSASRLQAYVEAIHPETISKTFQINAVELRQVKPDNFDVRMDRVLPET